MQTIVQTPSGLVAASNSSNAPTGRRHINCLTSLRIFPAIIVILFHAGEHFPCIRGCLNHVAVTQVMSFFFVLSGFILTLNYPRIDGFKATMSFYVARVARVWPAHVICLLLLIGLIPEAFKLTSASLPKFLANITLTHAWWPNWQYYFSFNAPSWSNSTDMVLYLAFPLLLVGLSDSKKRWLVAATVIGLTATAIVVCNVLHLPEFSPTDPSSQGILYVQPLTRLLEFAIGMSAALLFTKWTSRWDLGTAKTTILECTILGVVALLNLTSSSIRVASVPFLGEPGGYWLQNSGLPVFGLAALFMCLATEKGLIAKSLNSRVFVTLGELSFAIYMLHSVMLAHHGINNPKADEPGDFFLYLIVLLLSAHLLWRLAERPMRRIILSIGTFWLNLNSSNRQVHEAGSRAKSSGVSIWLIAECALLVVLIYCSMPTLTCISKAQAERSAPLAQVKDIAYSPFLKLKSAVARTSGRNSTLELIWESTRSQNPNFLIVADVLDASKQTIGHTSYMQDLRLVRVNPGDLWIERVNIGTAAGTAAKYFSIKVLQRKRNVLSPDTSAQPGPQPQTILVPITF